MSSTRREFLKLFGLGAVAAGTTPISSIIAAPPKKELIVPHVLDFSEEKPRWIPEPPVIKNPPQYTTAKFLEAFDDIAARFLHDYRSNNDIRQIFDLLKIASGEIVEFPVITNSNGPDAYTVGLGDEIHTKRLVDCDRVKVPTNIYYNSASVGEEYIRSARYDVVQDALQILQHGLKQELWISGWQCILAAGVDRNILVFDNDACEGKATTRLVSLIKSVMRRNGERSKAMLTDLYVSPEVMEDLNNNLLNDTMYSSSFDNRDKEIIDSQIQHTCNNTGFVNTLTIFGVNIHSVDELGVDQYLHNYFKNELGGAIAPWNVELVVGLDRSKSSFVMCEIKEPTCHSFVKNGRVEMYLDTEVGLAVLDNQSVILGSL